MIKIPNIVVPVVLTFSGLVYSQNTTPNNPPNTPQEETGVRDEKGRKGFWEANLSGGNYVVALGRIVSVSRHQYVLDGAVIVDEVTVDTEGQALARFYHISPITSGVQGTAAGQLTEKALKLADGAVRSAGSNLQDMVVKKYPLTTHAKTIEYRLLSKAQLNVLYQSVKTAWQTGQGRVFSGR